jgi:hypothetical protein
MSPTGLGLAECVVMERPVMARKADLGQGYIFKVTGSITPQPQRVFNRTTDVAEWEALRVLKPKQRCR